MFERPAPLEHTDRLPFRQAAASSLVFVQHNFHRALLFRSVRARALLAFAFHLCPPSVQALRVLGTRHSFSLYVDVSTLCAVVNNKLMLVVLSFLLHGVFAEFLPVACPFAKPAQFWWWLGEVLFANGSCTRIPACCRHKDDWGCKGWAGCEISCAAGWRDQGRAHTDHQLA